ncbi:Polysialic acid transport protein KpsM [Halomonadaceae bacterium LMG 33818]|uniref:ABC transporter permease n=1 Tax=Cernens ardua TaxID=3402176 RepID=UPI003EDBAE31
MSEVQPQKIRSPLKVTISVLNALLMREAISRTVGNRMAWFWTIAEPASVICMSMGIRYLRNGEMIVQGANYVVWSFLGIVPFQLVRVFARMMGAIDSSQGLFTYRQVKPFDTVIVRAIFDFLFITTMFCTYILIGSLMGWPILPAYPLQAIFAWCSIWVLGMSFGVLASAIGALVPEVKTLINIGSLPLFVFSGVIFPLTYIPPHYVHYLAFNPVVPAVEYLRASFVSTFVPIPGTSILYVWEWAMSFLVLGLIMQVRFKNRFIAN